MTAEGDPDGQLEQAWTFAHKVITLARAVPAREGCDLLNVKTAEVCRAMGQPDGARLEDVQRFVQQVLAFMRGYDLEMVCGCGYLSLIVGPQEASDRAWQENRQPTSYTPDDLEQTFRQVLAAASGGVEAEPGEGER